MDYYQLGNTALEARQFFEAEKHFRLALKQASEDRVDKIYEEIYGIAKAIRPETAWKEFEPWVREKEKKENWSDLLKCLEKNEKLIPQNYRGYIYELKSRVYLNSGQYEKARVASSEHLEHLLKKKLSHQYLRFSVKYSENFPNTILFCFHSIVASCLVQDVNEIERKIKSFFEMLNNKWHQLEDITPESKKTVISELCTSLEMLDRKNGKAVLMLHYCYLEKLRENKAVLRPEDWKKLVELLIENDSWRNLKLGLLLAIESNDEMLINELHLQLKTKKGFSFVKFTKNDQVMKRWLLARGHYKELETIVNNSQYDEIIEEEQVIHVQKDEVEELDYGFEELNEEEKVAERNAIKQLRLISPPLEMIPDLIVAYDMMNFGKVVDWLIHNYRDCGEYPQLQRKIHYHSVLRDMKLKNYYYALATLEEMLGNKDITLEELKELRYAQGAIYNALGDYKMSVKAFHEVEKIHPGYRKIRERNN